MLFGLFSAGSAKKTLPTFGQKRAEQLSKRLDKAIADRRLLARAEAASSNPLRTTYLHKIRLEERKIDRLTSKVLDANE